MTELEHAIKHIKTRADTWAVKEVTEALQSISERLDKALSQEPCRVKNELNVELNELKPCTDAVSRQAVLDIVNNPLNIRLDEIIKKLPSVNTQPCEDAISREAVDELSKELVHTTRDKADFLCNFWEGLQKLPPVTQKSGKWIERKNVAYLKGVRWKYECSECGYEVRQKYHYCPNCGAKMVKPQESEK